MNNIIPYYIVIYDSKYVPKMDEIHGITNLFNFEYDIIKSFCSLLFDFDYSVSNYNSLSEFNLNYYEILYYLNGKWISLDICKKLEQKLFTFYKTNFWDEDENEKEDNEDNEDNEEEILKIEYVNPIKHIPYYIQYITYNMQNYEINLFFDCSRRKHLEKTIKKFFSDIIYSYSDDLVPFTSFEEFEDTYNKINYIDYFTENNEDIETFNVSFLINNEWIKYILDQNTKNQIYEIYIKNFYPEIIIC